MPAGQTPHTIILYAHNDLVDKVQPGDRVNVTGIRWSVSFCRPFFSPYEPHYLLMLVIFIIPITAPLYIIYD